MASVTNQPSYIEWTQRWLSDLPAFFLRPIAIVRDYDRANLSPDLLAGLTVAFVMLPQAIAYALIAELPPQVGLYTAIVSAIVGALWGSSWHLHTGPTNAASLLVLSTLAPLFAFGSAEYVAAAALMAILVGIIRLLMGMVRLGALVNFVADSVIVGFTAGAGILIGVNQLRHPFRLDVQSDPLFVRTVASIFSSLNTTHLLSLGLGALTMGIILAVGHFRPKWPATLIGIIIISTLVGFFGLDQQGVIVLGELPRSLPPFVVPTFNYSLIEQMLTGVLAISLIGLIEAMSIAQSIASQSGQRIDSNQEFIGQGLANIAAGFFSGYTGSGSFTRSAINYDAGGKTPLAVVFSAVFVLIMMLVFAPFAAFLPRTALAGIIILTAYRMVNRDRMRRIIRTSQGDTAIMFATLFATLLLPLQFAVLTGILVAFIRFINQTANPSVTSVIPDTEFEHFVYRPDDDVCPQLAVITISGSLYFGATNHVEHEIREELEAHPDQIYALLRMHRVNHIDVSGINMLESLIRLYQKRGGDLYITGIRRDVFAMLDASGFVDSLGRDHFLPQERAIAHLFYKILDPARCIYHCKVRVWRECQTLPKSDCGCELPPIMNEFEAERVSAEMLHTELQSDSPPLVVDVRESAEYERGHIAHAHLLPLSTILATDTPDWATNQKVVITCRSSRRSVRAARAIHEQTGQVARILDGGMLAWEDAGLPEVIASTPI